MSKYFRSVIGGSFKHQRPSLMVSPHTGENEVTGPYLRNMIINAVNKIVSNQWTFKSSETSTKLIKFTNNNYLHKCDIS
jgi:hypothetical protein